MEEPRDGEIIVSCTMLITEPNRFVGEVHDRMPVLLTPDKWSGWLEGDDKSLLRPAPEGYLLTRKAVSKRINSSKADKDDATLIEEEKLLI